MPTDDIPIDVSKTKKRRQLKIVCGGCLIAFLAIASFMGFILHSALAYKARMGERLAATNEQLKPLGGYITHGRRTAESHILARIHPSPSFNDESMPAFAEAIRPWTDKADPDVGKVTLDLAGTAITDAGLVFLEPLERIDQIYLWDTQVTEKGVMEWLKKAKSYPGVIVEWKRPSFL